jgi:dTDP-4-dehydrorhamnose 3,5-epimerase
VKFARLQAFADERGRFMETFRTEWFPERSFDIIQTNRSDSIARVLRGLHYHLKQIDYWYVPKGMIRVGMADLRRGSPTFGNSQVIEIGDENQTGIFIPTGIAHGFLALTDATLTYLVDNTYDGARRAGRGLERSAIGGGLGRQPSDSVCTRQAESISCRHCRKPYASFRRRLTLLRGKTEKK